ncbi:hypothetical protein SLNWT_4196 [Streptomyces albus]|uniref:Uncharacterized protein n=1 Tax=Streptomyces albus (strain ATCC 21838 / DSM 41398 / FERM P-419 / JCM 4703 / NBRC 107858) TaxID=1081613 RepID=A0A0B5F2L0_STRA4|nr:hypothetical protein SLNWT_4196 [Streptomyces albus]
MLDRGRRPDPAANHPRHPASSQHPRTTVRPLLRVRAPGTRSRPDPRSQACEIPVRLDRARCHEHGAAYSSIPHSERNAP